MLHRGRTHGLKQVKRANDVGIHIRARFVDGIAHTSLTCEMDHIVGLFSGDQIHQHAVRFKAVVHCAKSTRLQKVRLTPFF